MAYTNTGVILNVPTEMYPSGWVSEAIDDFRDYSYRSKVYTLNIPKSDVETPSSASTFDNIIGDESVGVLAKVEDIMDDIMDEGVDIEYWVNISDITHNLLPKDNTDMYRDDPVVYTLKIQFYLKQKV